MQIATADGEEISLLRSDVCVSKSDALSVYRRAVANLTIQNGEVAIRRRRMSPDPASGRRLFSHAFAPPPSSRGEPDAGARVQDRLASAAGSWPQLLEPYRSRIAIGCHERRLKTHAHSYRQPAEVTLASFLSCVRIDLLRTHCAELNGSTAIFVNVTVGSDRDDNAAVPSISGSAGFYAGAGRHSESCRRGLRLRAQGRGKNLGIAVTKSGLAVEAGCS